MKPLIVPPRRHGPERAADAGYLDWDRRALLTGGLLALLGLPRAAVASQRTTRAEPKELLTTVRAWGCQYRNVDVAAIAKSDLDLIVLDPRPQDAEHAFIGRSACDLLRVKPNGQRRLALARLCVGETNVTRWYWPQAWRDAPPAWAERVNPARPGVRHVEFWQPEWQSLVFSGNASILDLILEAGYDGVVLDHVDAFMDWTERPSAQDDMVTLVARLAAKARQARPDFLLMTQNAEGLMTRPDYLALIDAHNKESLLTGLEGYGRFNMPEDVVWSMSYLRQASNAGVTMFATEYLSEPAVIDTVRRQLRAWNFVPFFASPALDRLPSSEEKGG
ncbi:endo alpha-1,4 polygalactosaminidase [Blastochloris sulfoviridis]|uniref:Glycoside-hydrolase family GH114 TIM-barrel domain-containing protein n=1 Tax=Blastochloris sulfoviridis TaxID=50712 RepID=A0A5M6HIS1_9HYPH|nr:endo alpha-1,4 polygalactosaminidase [Blastochloris sulfoviridis]KAA5595741.1 hypothetical protein F1193_16295 [Blastochloris sulfoviridis]